MNSTNSFYDEVLAMLNDGKEMTDIAKRITEDMNKAQADFNASKKAAAAKARKISLVGAIYDTVQAYMQEFAPDLINAAEDRDENIELVMNSLDAFVDVARDAKEITAEMDKDTGKMTKKVEIRPLTASEADKIIKNWLKTLDF